ncbi:MAG: hypothetical protein ACXWE7_11830, partial [Nitrososphaeraceae archaeon]
MTTRTTGKLVLTNQTSNQDAFDRLRISDVSSLIDIAPDFGKNPMRVDELTTGSGAVVENIGVSTVSLNVGPTVGNVIRQT